MTITHISRRSPLHHLLPHRHLRVFSTRPTQVTVGIRREDPGRIWERRCPLTPEAVDRLVRKEGVRVLVQDCDRRVFGIGEFVKAGAEIHSTLTPAHIIIGIKETPLPELVSSPAPSPHPHLSSSPSPELEHTMVPRTHLMFSHTTKGQPYNMELLSRFLRGRGGNWTESRVGMEPRLVDYELILGEDGKRCVGFGWFAGVAGALESLSTMAHAHLELGVASPFLHTPRPHTHPSIPSLRAKLREVGEHIVREGTPRSLGPFVFGLTGNGNVAHGVLDILKELPIVKVGVGDLQGLVYLVHALPQDYLFRKDGGLYSRENYYKHPGNYRSDFHTKVAPYLTLFINGTAWNPSFPRLMTNEQLAVTLERAQQVGRGRFTSVGDISCDIEGGLEFLTRASTLSDPCYTVRPTNIPAHLPSVHMMAVDILPSSLPLDASKHFSDAMFPYLQSLIREYRGEKEEEGGYREPLNRATIARAGELVGKHKWLEEPLSAWRDSVALTEVGSSAAEKPGNETGMVRKKKVLMLGSGMVAGPAVEEICKRGDVELLVASNSIPEATRLVNRHPNARSFLVDMLDQEQVGRLVDKADVVISLLPVPYHPSVAELCIKHRKHLVTASYISPAMKALHQRFVSADVLLLNEIGLDPGIDHCSAISLLSTIHAQNKRVVSFTSFCGGLPAPENADVPFGYKFSWSPRGVLGAALNGARFKLNGTDWEIPGENILTSHFQKVPVSDILKLEGIANRDSIPYANSYDLGPVGSLRTVLRGTLRLYPGFCDMMHSFKTLGLLEDAEHIVLQEWKSFLRMSLEIRHKVQLPDNSSSLVTMLTSLIPPPHFERVVRALVWLSLVPGDAASLPPLPKKPAAPIDLFTMVLAHKLKYKPGERDLVILSHEIVARSIDKPGVDEIYTSSLVTYGTPTASAMSRCVGLPVAFATLQVLDGKVPIRGVQGPTDATVYIPVLEGLQEVGLGMKENFSTGKGMEDTLAESLSSRYRR
ncbi:hypothetical protein PILCRDRAFT_74408 [Piloderma croceum F 1598]|uniref:Alanine dehydrogenase/pyridine nucleotide transhydrogenase N-terminal domain-containing protein n=1 Tax=Piloderma croceum (strain F 1598) TaxID=765440 RepID=A0A0C3AZE5_PILCF|nr:hypothetical protein PILCRDRAFT_74408 [Piloderma croceum F 1598]